MIITGRKFWKQFTTIFLVFVLSGTIGVVNFVQAASPITLSVSLSSFQGTVSTVYDYLVIEATIMASGSPVSGASVTFSDSRSSAFNGQIANTNSSGIALTTVQFNNGWNGGIDTITASATATGYNSNTGSENITILPGSASQLYISPSLANKAASGGSTDVISGTVADYNSAVPGATVTISDTIGSTFSNTPVLTNANGVFSTNFTIANIGTSAIDLITVGEALNGYSPSQSTIVLQVNPYNSSDLTVTMNTFYPSTTSTVYNYIILEATVTAAGTPVSGASVAFSDLRSSAFNGQTANTNSSGIALTTVQFNNGWNGGIDTITASATATGYSGGVCSNNINILAGSATQLYVIPSLANKIAAGGSTDVISGTVGDYNGAVPGATVTISDTIGSTFSNTTILTNANGVFSTYFTMANITTSVIDLVTVGVSSNGFSSSQSTIILQVNPYSSSDLTVAMTTFYPSTISTPQNFMVIEATVTAGGSPVSGASVAFSDSRGSSFNGQIAITNSSGMALTTLELNNGWTSGIDTITASATATGYSGGVCSNIVNLLPGSATQLYVTMSLTNKIAAGGSTDVISGTVAYYGGNAQGATVTISDSIGSTFNITIVSTDKNGYFAANFILPNVVSTTADIITASISEPGYSGSSSGIYLQVNPYVALTISISPTSATFNVGQSKTFTATTSGGSGTYTSYQWYLNGFAQSGRTASTFSYSPASAGSYSITATVTDSLGSTSAQSTAAVVTALVIQTPTPTSTPTPTPTPSPSTTAGSTSSDKITPTPSIVPKQSKSPVSIPNPFATLKIPGFKQVQIIAILIAISVVCVTIVVLYVGYFRKGKLSVDQQTMS